MSNADVINAVRVIALAEATEETPDAWYKSKCRWYSREFHTPLKDVLEMPIEVILRTWYDDLYWALAHGDEAAQTNLNQIVLNTLASESKTYQEEAAQNDAEDDDWYEQEIAALHAKTEAQNLEIAKKTIKPDKNGILITKPNLAGEAKTTVVNPVDLPVFDDSDDAGEED